MTLDIFLCFALLQARGTNERTAMACAAWRKWIERADAIDRIPVSLTGTELIRATR